MQEVYTLGTPYLTTVGAQSDKACEGGWGSIDIFIVIMLIVSSLH